MNREPFAHRKQRVYDAAIAEINRRHRWQFPSIQVNDIAGSYKDHHGIRHGFPDRELADLLSPAVREILEHLVEEGRLYSFKKKAYRFFTTPEIGRDREAKLIEEWIQHEQMEQRWEAAIKRCGALGLALPERTSNGLVVTLETLEFLLSNHS